jgi:peroxiredoxin
MPATLNEAYEHARALDAPLAERLEAYASSMRQMNKPMAEAVDGLIARLQSGHTGINAPGKGDPMPPFLLPDHTGRLVALDALVAKGPVAITFARGHWCPYCRIAVSALAEIATEAIEAGAQIVAIVPDRQEYAAKLRAEANAPFPVLTDIDNAYALSLGLVFWVGDEIRQHMLARGADPSQSQGNDSWFVPVPATFIVGRDGNVFECHVDPDYRRRMGVEAVLAALTSAARG